jgi:hypothetical protein
MIFLTPRPPTFWRFFYCHCEERSDEATPNDKMCGICADIFERNVCFHDRVPPIAQIAGAEQKFPSMEGNFGSANRKKKGEQHEKSFIYNHIHFTCVPSCLT